jgi:hypothetical protein
MSARAETQSSGSATDIVGIVLDRTPIRPVPACSVT